MGPNQMGSEGKQAARRGIQAESLQGRGPPVPRHLWLDCVPRKLPSTQHSSEGGPDKTWSAVRFIAA